MHVAAIVVARGGSRRVPGKALRPFGSTTLIGHKVDQLLQCPSVDEVIVGSDCPDILREARCHGADAIQRDDYHCDEDRCSANEMIRDMVSKIEADAILWAHPTNPLCMPDIYEKAISSFKTATEMGIADSLCSVTVVRRHAWQNGQPANFNPWDERHPLAAELEPTQYQDGAIFIQPREQMLENAYFYGRKPVLFEIPSLYGLDIDTERDLLQAQAIYEAMCAEVAA